MKTPPDIQHLLDQGWRECPDHSREYARCFFKRFDTPTRCHCNDDKAGIQVCIARSEFGPHISYEIDICGELADESWVKLMNYGYTNASIVRVLSTIHRLLAAWEVLNQAEPA